MFLTSLTSGHDLDRAVVVGDEAVSRAELVDRAGRFAAGIPGDGPVAVHATASLDTVVAVTGCILAGVPVVPVPPDSGPAERGHVLRDSGATAWAGDRPDGVDLPAVVPGGAAVSLREIDPEHTAMLLYTSGTTGAPKGAQLSGRAIASGLDGLFDVWDWTPDDTVVHGLPLFHVHGLILGVLGALRRGSRVVHTVKPQPARYAAAGGTMYFGVPTVWNRIVEDPESARALGRARLLVSGSAPLPATLFERIAGLTGQAPVERYGMTETMITLSARASGERRAGWVGMPVPGAETRLLPAADGETGEVPDDGETVGRLEVRGPMLFGGYLNRPDANDECWAGDGWFRTGDLAVREPGGFHRIVGRESTDLIKSGGYRIGSGEIEAVLMDHPGVAEVAVVGAPDPDLGQRIVAFVVGEGTAEALIDHVASQLSWHKRPREVVFVDALPRNPMGKVQKKLLGQ
ncbi:Long-chain-fatty-acid--CoA ligase [Pseudonocardia sp. Ae168_Ps1]|uniref:acyl-CoA synthetase n=1 Tax=unclassified Pseudonocardia TaxID=2619320 RepID=UPI00094ABAD2|nr:MULTISPECIES: acyl-CoA synthetase [unclassified Pseudonocardia]OLL72455.1 Long-chain-fatty-acid--CoA ligase [Pseudonocardia sp. Ae150A_Ps1]OLL78427.1 Long-chain-fatty-acid--CoA ligase [Pseudonocardia sp. Ae168_Ps1]OLL87447.1 Long-chain-fatty-acid--CoA ligase [Pseudonocardia sp. Ae263_Ps1]OLL92524.1 Long-chain-fatty-acid--CoA ligase [Pseudonocardia sp. Ae356_Ps1]